MADKYPIDLGTKPMGEPAALASSPSKEKYYPSLHLEWDDEYPLPDSGEMTVKFVKTGETKSTHSGKTRHSVTLEIKSIESASEGDEDDESAEEESDSKEESTGDRLDKMAKEASDEEDY